MSDILDRLYERLDNCQHYGHYLACVCIFHDDSRPSMMIYEDTYHCLSCGKFGKTSDLLASLNNNTVLLRPQTKPNFRNPWSKWTKNSNLVSILKSSWKILKNEPYLGKYLNHRGIDSSTCTKLGIGYKEDWYTIPIRSKDNKIVGAVARANAVTNPAISKYMSPYGQSTDLLYVPSWQFNEQYPYMYLTFGILDAVILFILGKPSASTTGGKHIDPSALDSIRKPIKIIPDQGEEQDANLLASKLGWRGQVIHLDYPYTTKDVNDLYLYNPEELERSLHNECSQPV